MVAQAPWLVYFAMTFLRVPPPIMPSLFRRFMLFIAIWYTVSIAALAILAFAVPRPLGFYTPYEEVFLWLGSLMGLAAMPTVLRCCKDLADVPRGC